jgi:hypothetical protein
MRYSYTNTTQVPVALEFTLHDITTLLNILDPIAADDDHGQRYHAAAAARFLRDAHAKACETIAGDIAYERTRTA